VFYSFFLFHTNNIYLASNQGNKTFDTECHLMSDKIIIDIFPFRWYIIPCVYCLTFDSLRNIADFIQSDL
jgi:hypothetical protein